MTMSKLWLCQNCETLHPLSQLICEVCGESIPVEYREPVISEFKASAKQARDNEPIVFSWKTVFAKYVFLNGIRVPANGTKEIPATEKATLKVSNGNGSLEKSINITVIRALVLDDFSVNKTDILFGSSCKVTWTGRNIKKVFCAGEEFSTGGPIVLKPRKSSDFEVLFEGIEGDTIKRTFTVHVSYPSPIIEVNAPEFARIGETIHINWKTKYIQSVTIDGIKQPVIGSYDWTYNETYNHKSIIFIDMEGVAHEKQVYVKEATPPKILSFYSTIEEVSDIEGVTLKWSTENAKYVFLNATRVAAEGSKVLPASERYKLKASNDFGAIEKIICVKVLHYLKITRFNVERTSLKYGNPCIVRWEGRNVSKILLDGYEYEVCPKLCFTPLESRSYIVKFEGPDGQSIEKRIDIDITFPEPVINIKTPAYGKSGAKVKIEWEMKNVMSVQIGDVELSPKDSFEWQYQEDNCGRTLHIKRLDNTFLDKTIKIRAAQSPIINSVSLSKDNLQIGDSCSLSWSGDYVAKWFIDGQSIHDGNVKSTIVRIGSEHIKAHFIGEDDMEITRDVYNITKLAEPESKNYYGCLIIILLLLLLFLANLGL